MAWIHVCKVMDLPEAGGAEFVVAGRVVALFRQPQGVVALDGMCAHQGGPLAQGRLDGDCLTCPWHGWQYDVRSGCNQLTGKRMLDTFPTKIRDSAEVWIELPED